MVFVLRAWLRGSLDSHLTVALTVGNVINNLQIKSFEEISFGYFHGDFNI